MQRWPKQHDYLEETPGQTHNIKAEVCPQSDRLNAEFTAASMPASQRLHELWIKWGVDNFIQIFT